MFFLWYGDHQDLHVLTHSFPTRRSSDLAMFFLFEARLEKPPEMSRTDFYDLWRKDAGSDRLMVVFDMASRDRIDALMQELPIWTLDAQHIARDVKWTPLREDRKSTRLNSSH